MTNSLGSLQNISKGFSDYEFKGMVFTMFDRVKITTKYSKTIVGEIGYIERYPGSRESLQIVTGLRRIEIVYCDEIVSMSLLDHFKARPKR